MNFYQLGGKLINENRFAELTELFAREYDAEKRGWIISVLLDQNKGSMMKDFIFTETEKQNFTRICEELEKIGEDPLHTYFASLENLSEKPEDSVQEEAWSRLLQAYSQAAYAHVRYFTLRNRLAAQKHYAELGAWLGQESDQQNRSLIITHLLSAGEKERQWVIAFFPHETSEENRESIIKSLANRALWHTLLDLLPEVQNPLKRESIIEKLISAKQDDTLRKWQEQETDARNHQLILQMLTKKHYPTLETRAFERRHKQPYFGLDYPGYAELLLQRADIMVASIVHCQQETTKPVELIILDKGARPIAFMLRKRWRYLAENGQALGPMPPIRFMQDDTLLKHRHAFFEDEKQYIFLDDVTVTGKTRKALMRACPNGDFLTLLNKGDSVGDKTLGKITMDQYAS